MLIQKIKAKPEYRIEFICDVCSKKQETGVQWYEKSREKFGKDLCRRCKINENKANGAYMSEAVIAHNKKQKGRTLEDIHGTEKAAELRKLYSENSKGEKNSAYGKSYFHVAPQKGKTLEEFYGEEKAAKIKKKISKASSGSNNPMFGKPSPVGSGNGYSGWYKDFYFRSILELSFIIYCEQNNIKIESAEKAEYKVPCIKLDGKEGTYIPDFIINDEEIVEIKPFKLSTSKSVMQKTFGAKEFFESKNLKYSIKTDKDFPKIDLDEVYNLYSCGIIKFIQRYEKKFLEYYEKNKGK